MSEGWPKNPHIFAIAILLLKFFCARMADGVELLPATNVCAARPSGCNILCPYGYIRDILQQCLCTCAIDPCQTTICSSNENCISIGIKARCIPKFGSNREECPRLTGGVCALRCEKDADCSGRLICCSNGCGRECVAPVIARSFSIKPDSQSPIKPVGASNLPGSFQRLINAVSNIATNTPIPPTIRNIANIFLPSPSASMILPEVVQNTKVGQCPSPLANQSIICDTGTKCTNDMECSNMDKCCPNECGATCVEPLKATGCIHLALAISKLPDRRLANEYVPFCERNGRFSAIQCDLEFCWCVDVHYGSEIVGTRVNRNQRRVEMCQERRLCSQKCNNQCTHGHVMDPFGCPNSSCRCVDLCESAKCANSWEKCQLVEPDCANPPCLPVPRCLLNPCKNSRPSRLLNGITALCSSNKDCVDAACFKIGYNGLGFCCPGQDTTSKDGRCPSKSADRKICTNLSSNMCYSDSDCVEDNKCCFNGCVLECTPPEDYSLKMSTNRTSIPMHYQPGDVEKYNKGHLSSLVADCADITTTNGTCKTDCHSDSQCIGMKRCCRQGCSTSCMFPVRSTPCFHLALTAELYALRNALKCDRAGNFEQYQCDDEGCYCVDITTGEELPGTRALGRKPNCASKNPCEPVICKAECPYGYEKAQNNCPTCRCKNPCLDVKCPQGSVCVMSSVECYQTGNCPSQPRCILNFCPTGYPHISSLGNVESCSKDSECPSETHWCHQLGISSGGICCPTPARVRHAGTCPIVPISLDAKMCSVMCRVDDDCRGGQRCCFDGCGTTCKDITSPLIEISKENFEKAGICISEQRVLCNRLEKNTCEYDTDCAGVAKCCDDGCVKACAYPLQMSKCLVRKTNLQKMGQMDLIKCRPDGSFEPIQCDVEYCWCVNEEGTYINGTRSAEDIEPKCPAPCPKPDCGPAVCEYGRKKDSQGCATCDCVDPCDGVSCHADSVCIPTSVPCVAKPCPIIPRCVINPCPLSEMMRNETSLKALRCDRANDCYSPTITTHCSMLTMKQGFCCTGEQPSIHSGSCPMVNDINTSVVDKCVQECKTDSDCKQASKCCWNGCGLTCVTVTDVSTSQFSLQTSTEGHFGECMKVSPLGAFCLQRPTIADCKLNSDCPALYICCSDGCVMRCTHPYKAPLCVHQRISALSTIDREDAEDSSVFIPDCDVSGRYDEVQSHFGLMWCVDAFGMEVPGTKSVRVPDCDHPRPCPNRNCPGKCPFGYKTDNDGCPVCDCVSPCEYLDCPAGNLCRLVPVQCTTRECLPVPKCVPNMCPTGEPLAFDFFLSATCSPISPCPAGFYCKNSGFGEISVCCALPELETEKSLECPAIPQMLASVDGSSCVVGCRRHTDCRQSSCCFNGCGMSCQFETNRRPIKPIRKTLLNSLKIERKASKIENVVEHQGVSQFPPVQPITAPITVTPIKIGSCPKLLLNPGCSEQCRQDSDCHGFFKCCTASCGTLCSAPRIATACIHRLIAFESVESITADNSISLIDSPPVQCDPDGQFRRHQCNTDLGQCWCVDKSSGIEVIGTRINSIGIPVPDCTVRRKCNTQCDLQNCPFGIRLDSTGCPTDSSCECNNICSTLKCPQGMECALRAAECTSQPCPDVPVCVNVQKCAILQRDQYKNPIACQNNGACGMNVKCIHEAENSLGVCCYTKPAQSSAVSVFVPPITSTISSFSPITVIEAVPVINISDQQTNCTSMRDSLSSLRSVGATIRIPDPQCSPITGNYETTQCDKTRCWCADPVSGEEIHGTRKKRTKNACKTQSLCPSMCSSSICPYGLLLDSTGCPHSECTCKSACEHVECPTGQICILRKADCRNQWCLPIPKCEPSPCNSGLRPLIESRTRQQYSCSQNTVCPTGYYCTAFDGNMNGVCCPAIESIKSIGEASSSCSHGDPFSQLADGTPISCTALTNGCPATHYCSTMAGQKYGVCCVSKRHVCNLQNDAGPCSATLTRYHYSSITHSCDPFQYGGCAGNLNNFPTKESCESFCAGVGLDLSSPFDQAITSARSPIDSYQIAFGLTGPSIEESRKLDAERQIINYLVEKFTIPRDSIQDVIIGNENTVRFTIRDVEAKSFAKRVSDVVSTGVLNIPLFGLKYRAEPQTLMARHVSDENPTNKSTAKVVFYAILLATSIFVTCVICVFCLSCLCYFRNTQKNDRSSTPSNTITPTDHHRQGRNSHRIFSRDNISICSEFNRPPLTINTSMSNQPTRPRSQSWISIG